MPDNITGSQAVIAQLVAEGVHTVLSIPGEHNIPLCDAALDHPGLQFITGRHEQSLGFMAEGYARASGKIAIPLVITGPGVCNSATALADAYQDSVPMVLIAAHPVTEFLGKGAFHELKDQTCLLASVTKWNRRVKHVEEVPEAIRTAFEQAYSGRPGPTAVEIPLEVQSQRGRAEIYPSEPPARHQADPATVHEACRLLSEAASPLVYVGNGAAISGCSAELTKLVERLNAPCLATALAKGVIADNHPLNVGCMWITRKPAREFFDKADTVLVVGSSLDEVETRRWTLPLGKDLIHIDVCPEMIGRNYPAALGLVGDAKVVLAQMLKELENYQPSARSSATARVASVKAEIQTELAGKPAWHFIKAIERALPQDAVVTNDASTVNGWVLTCLDRFYPRTCSVTRNLAALGYALPAALGAKLAFPNRQAVAIVGDGGFLFSDSALSTAVQFRLNAVAIVFNDRGYRSIERIQTRRFGRTIGVELHNPDFVKLAEAHGAAGAQAEEPEQLYEALIAAWERTVPTLIEVPLDVGGDFS